MRTVDQACGKLAIKMLTRAKPALETMVVLAGKVINDHRSPEQAAHSKGWGGGTRSRGRTGTAAKPGDFKSPVSTYSTIRATQFIIPARKLKKGKCLRTFPSGSGAGKESRTLDLYLAKESLYQLSYSRKKPDAIFQPFRHLDQTGDQKQQRRRLSCRLANPVNPDGAANGAEPHSARRSCLS